MDLEKTLLLGVNKIDQLFEQMIHIILLNILVCGIAVYFYASCSILASPKGKSKYR